MTQKNSFNIIFAGTPEFAVVALEALIHSPHTIAAVYTQPDRPAGRGRKVTPSPVKQLALKNDLTIYQPVNFHDEHDQQVLINMHADVMVVVAYGLLLPIPILQAPHLGCINIHASLLPRWRGAAPIQRAILAGDAKTGVTIMRMEEGLDTGPMFYKVECSILPDDTSQTLHDRLAIWGAEALLHTLNQLPESNPQPQNNSLMTYAKKISKEEANLDWHLPAEELARKVRAFNPWPIAFTHSAEKVLRIFDANVIEKSQDKGVPGEIRQTSPAGIDIATGKNLLRLLKLQLPGGRVLSVADILNSRQSDFAVGKILG